MLLSMNHIRGYRIQATDDELGKVRDFLFDDHQWTVRYIEVDTGHWLPGRRVVVTPDDIKDPDWAGQVLPVELTRDQIEDSPPLAEHEPLSRHFEQALVAHYDWAPYWNLGPVPAYSAAPVRIPVQEERDDASDPVEQPREPNLRSEKEVKGYRIDARDGQFGQLDDMIVDTDGWVVRYLVVDTKRWWPGGGVLVAPEWCSHISWTDQLVHVDQTKDEIKSCPEYDPDKPVNREFEVRLYDYFGRPVYW